MSAAAGGQFLDMGALEFAPRTDVNESLTMGYQELLKFQPARQAPINLRAESPEDGNLYCVAPIVTSGTLCSDPLKKMTQHSGAQRWGQRHGPRLLRVLGGGSVAL